MFGSRISTPSEGGAGKTEVKSYVVFFFFSLLSCFSSPVWREGRQALLCEGGRLEGRAFSSLAAVVHGEVRPLRVTPQRAAQALLPGAHVLVPVLTAKTTTTPNS